MQRRHVLAAAMAASVPGAFAQAAWPAKPIRFIVPFPPGGGTDTTSRLIAEKFTTLLGWTVIVDNKAGAGGNIGLDVVAKAPPDGYTIGMGQASNLAINPSLYAKMPFDPLKDFSPIASIAEQPVVLVVRQDSPLKTLADFVDAARAKPGGVGVAQAGNGTVGHLAGELLERRAGIQLLQVPGQGRRPGDERTPRRAETVKLLARPDVKDKLAFEGSEATPGTAQQFAAHIRAEHAKWAALIREANIKLE